MLDKLPVPKEDAIRKTYEFNGEDSAFKIFLDDGVSHEEIRDALGEEVCDRYAMWIYKNVK